MPTLLYPILAVIITALIALFGQLPAESQRVKKIKPFVLVPLIIASAIVAIIILTIKSKEPEIVLKTYPVVHDTTRIKDTIIKNKQDETPKLVLMPASGDTTKPVDRNGNIAMINFYIRVLNNTYIEGLCWKFDFFTIKNGHVLDESHPSTGEIISSMNNHMHELIQLKFNGSKMDSIIIAANYSYLNSLHVKVKQPPQFFLLSDFKLYGCPLNIIDSIKNKNYTMKRSIQ